MSTFIKCHPSYQATFQMHWDSKILLNGPNQEATVQTRSPFLWRSSGHTRAGLSFEASCRWNLTSTLYSAAGYFLCIKENKSNAKHGVSPRLKIWPGDLDLWPWKSIGFQILLRTKNVPSLVKIHYQSLIIVMTLDLSIVNNTSQTGRRVAIFHWPAKVWYLCMAWTKDGR